MRAPRFASPTRTARLGLLLAGLAPAAAAQIQLDLSTLPAGPTLERLAEGRSYYITLSHLLPGAAYRISFGPRYPSAELLQLDVSTVERLRLSASRGSNCPELPAVLDATDEAGVARALARLESGSAACPGWERGELTRLVRRQAATPVRVDADEEDEPLRVVVERLLANGEVGRSWTLDYAPPPARTSWTTANETEWLVSEVSLDLVEMASFADGRQPFDAKTAGFQLATVPPAGKVAFDLSASGRRGRLALRIELADHVWSPRDYEPLARALQKPLAVRPPGVPGTAGAGSLDALPDLRSSVLERESQRVSRLLDADMLQASAHEQAAIVLAGLSLRESAGYFADPRRLLCRMTAHLAWAGALRRGGPASVDGRVAEAALLVLVGRQHDALGALERLEPDAAASPALRAWLHALRLRATSDFRMLRDPATASLLERLEHFRALAWSLGADHAYDFAREHGRENVPDWSRRALARGVGVEVGNAYTAVAAGLELADLAETWQAAEGSPLTDLDVALGASPQRCIQRRQDGSLTPRVIGWGHWAASFQRHLMQALDRTDEHLRNSLAIRARADAFAKEADARFARLPLHAFVRLRRDARIRAREDEKLAKKASGLPPDCPAAVSPLRDEPERVAPLNWLLARRRCHGSVELGTVPRPRLWFTTGVPPGTAFEATRRLGVSGVSSLVRPQLDALAARAPYDFELARQAVEARAGRTPSPSALEAAYGPLLEYHTGALWDRAQASEDDVAEYRRVSERILALDADSGLAVGEHLSRQGLEQAAADAFETAVRGARDRVAVANRCEWLVDYYLDHGREQDALRLAEEAADAYSARGILTLARLLERLGRFPEALAWLNKEVERYDDKRSLEEFELRRERRVPGEGHLEAAHAALRKHFPQGLERVDLRDFLAAPLAGVEIRQRSQALASLGLEPGDVIVALDGYRTASYQQYRIVRDLTDEPEIHLIAWHGDRYVEAKGSFRRRSFGVLLRDYEAEPVY